MTDGNRILEEIWKARKEIEEENQSDLGKIYAKYSERQQKNPAEYHSGKPVEIKKTKAA